MKMNINFFNKINIKPIERKLVKREKEKKKYFYFFQIYNRL